MPPSVMASDTDSENATNVLTRLPASKGTVTKARVVSAAKANNTNIEEGSKALHEAQQEVFALRQQMKKLKLNVDSRAIEDRKSKSRAPSKAPGDPDDPGNDDGIISFDADISKYGRKYSLMISPWLNPNVFDGLKGRPDVDPSSKDRYDTKESMSAGTIAELYDFIPENLHGLMRNHSRFATLFRHHLQSARSNSISSVRQRCGFLYSLKQDYFDVSFDRASIPELQAMLRIPKKNSGSDQTSPYALLAPILFEGGKYDRSLKLLFKNPLLPNIATVMLYGKAPNTKSKPQTLGEIWKVTAATPGLIAFTAVLARFFVSPDEEFCSKGKITKIEWEQEFTMYKRMLSANSSRVCGIFEFFNENVFGRSSKDVQPGSTELDSIEEFEDAMRVFGADDSFDDGSDADSDNAKARDVDSSDDDTVSLLDDDHTVLLDKGVNDSELAFLSSVANETSQRQVMSDLSMDSGVPDRTMIIDSDEDMYISSQNYASESQDPKTSQYVDCHSDSDGDIIESAAPKARSVVSAQIKANAQKRGSLASDEISNPSKTIRKTVMLVWDKKAALDSIVPEQISSTSASESESLDPALTVPGPSLAVDATTTKSKKSKSGGPGKKKSVNVTAIQDSEEANSDPVVGKVALTFTRKSTRKAKASE